jgi:hypothetical protein
LKEKEMTKLNGYNLTLLKRKVFFGYKANKGKKETAEREKKGKLSS